MNTKKYISKYFLIIPFFIFSNISAEEIRTNYFYKNDTSWDISFYGGKYTETDLLPIILRQNTRYQDSNIYVFALSKELDYRFRFFNFEVEGNIAKHDGIMNHWELNALYIARINNLFTLPMSFAIGEGVSLASENPKLENKRKGFDWENFTFQTRTVQSRNILNFVMVELEFGKKESDWPRIFFRVHHRSGVFGLYCPPDPACGSNFITYGIRYPLNKIIP
ncbi:MAG: hypothetical protein JJT78_01460 [Leptospira sp.]|nr:hypothetical protein [Leptospira sp.]